MQGALITVSLILGIPVLRSKDPSETARIIVYIGRQLELIARGGVHRHGYRPKDKRKRQLLGGEDAHADQREQAAVRTGGA